MNFKDFIRIPRRRQTVPVQPFNFLSNNQVRLQEVTTDASKNSAAIAVVGLITTALTSSTLVVKNSRGTIIQNHPLTNIITNDVLSHVIRTAYFYSDSVALIAKYENSEEIAKLESINPKSVEITRAYVNDNQFNGTNQYIVQRGNFSKVTFVEEEVFHFNLAPSIEKPWAGVSPLVSCINELKTDESVRVFVMSYLKNHGSPGIVVYPDDEKSSWDADTRAKIRQAIDDSYTGGSAGKTLALPTKVTVHNMAGPRQQADMATVAILPESRIAGVCGVPPVLAGLYVGLRETQTNATLRQLRLQFAEGTLLPLQRRFATALQQQVMIHIPGSEQYTVEFDNSENFYFQEDQDAIFERYGRAYERGGITLNEYREMIGMPATNGGDSFLTDVSTDVTMDER